MYQERHDEFSVGDSHMLCDNRAHEPEQLNKPAMPSMRACAFAAHSKKQTST